MMLVTTLGLTLCFTLVTCAPSVTQTPESFVVISSEPTPNLPVNSDETTKKTENEPLAPPKIYAMKVDTNVTNRFATTRVTSKVKNLADKAQEATFAVILPETAYISGFIMEIDGKKYEAYVQEKQQAKQTYDNAVASGIGAAHVEAKARDSNRFVVSVNIEPQSKATFYLNYEELLQRKEGKYDIVINLHPGQAIKDLGVEVNINETRPLTFVKAPSLRSGNEVAKNDEKLDPKAVIEHFNKTAAKVTFKPDIERQKELAKNMGGKEGNGLAGQFVVQYDVERDPQGGEILLSDGYFVHFFAPSDLKPLKKHIVFVLDTSGSMYGRRIEQLKEAMKNILGQLSKDDTFNLIDFNSITSAWNIPKAEVQYTEGEDSYYPYYHETNQQKKNKTDQTLPESFEASSENIKQAEKVIDKLSADGGTDIQSGLIMALKLIKLNKEKSKETPRQSMVVFLTDGEVTVGEINNEKIISLVVKENVYSSPIFALSFGDGADRKFLEKISLKNQGFARHIYEAADSSLQLQEFYKSISSPLLRDVHFKYVSESVNTTKSSFPIFFRGAEIAICGTYDPTYAKFDGSIIDPGFAPQVTGLGPLGPVNFVPRFENPVGSLEKHWAYLTLKQILDERDAAENKTELTQKALDLALKYSFVTPVTSLVVVKPNATSSESNPEDASKTKDFGFNGSLRPYARPMFALSAPAPAYFGGQPVAFSSSNYASMSIDRFAQVEDAIFLSTPLTLPTTQLPKLEKTDDVDGLQTQLPWLDSATKENSTLEISGGKYYLGNEKVLTLDDVYNCSKPQNETGVCTLLKDCPQVLSLLTDFKTYTTDYFCPLNEFAGVCCPDRFVDNKWKKSNVSN